MPIVVKLDDMLHARRMTLTELAERMGITLANLSILKTGKARAVRFSTLEAICEVLQCQPGDLLEYAPTSVAEEAVVADHAAASSATRRPLKRRLDAVPEEA
jgi:putative transcriptional regulator